MSTEDPYRTAVKASIASIIKQTGFTDVEFNALSSLVEMATSIMVQLAKSSKHYSELSNRTQVMVSDVSLALIDSGISLEEVKVFAEKNINKQPGFIPPTLETEPAPTKSLTINTNKSIPPYVHENLPAFPDLHTYIQTGAQRLPSTDYQLVREKAANEKKAAETALTKFIAKTKQANYFCDDLENPINAAYPLIACRPTPLSYLTALLPKDEDQYEVFDLKHEQEVTDSAKRVKIDPGLCDSINEDDASDLMEC